MWCEPGTDHEKAYQASRQYTGSTWYHPSIPRDELVEYCGSKAKQYELIQEEQEDGNN